MVETTPASELSALHSAIVIPLGRATGAIAHLRDLGTLDHGRLLLGLPHPSPASPFRERYFRAAKAELMRQVQRLGFDAAPPKSGRLLSGDFQERRPSTPPAGSVPEGQIDRIVIGLTQGNINNNHVYLRNHLDFFPADAIGAANAQDRKRAMLTLHFEGLAEPVETDIAGDTKIFRCRGDMGSSLLAAAWPKATASSYSGFARTSTASFPAVESTSGRL